MHNTINQITNNQIKVNCWNNNNKKTQQSFMRKKTTKIQPTKNRDTKKKISPLAPLIGLAVGITPIIIGGIQLYKGGKLNTVNKIGDFLSNNTKLLQGKFANNYYDEVKENITKVFSNQNPTNAGKRSFKFGLISKLLPSNTPEAKTAAKILDWTPEYFKESIKRGTWREDLIKKTKIVPKGKIKNYIDKISKADISNEAALKFVENTETIAKNIPEKQFSGIVDSFLNEFHKDPEKFKHTMNKENLKEIFLTKGIKKAGMILATAWIALSTAVGCVANSLLTKKDKQAN